MGCPRELGWCVTKTSRKDNWEFLYFSVDSFEIGVQMV
jgi:hypothetical protein